MPPVPQAERNNCFYESDKLFWEKYTMSKKAIRQNHGLSFRKIKHSSFLKQKLLREEIMIIGVVKEIKMTKAEFLYCPWAQNF